MDYSPDKFKHVAPVRNAVKLSLKQHLLFRCVAPYRQALIFFYKYHGAPHLFDQGKAAPNARGEIFVEIL